jgi:tetraacyldisaccharide-1-P 4'-kinase
MTAFENDWVAGHCSDVATACATLEADDPRLARRGGGHAPTVALTGVMKPNLFFDFVRDRCPSVDRMQALGDHGVPGKEWTDLLEEAHEGGFVMTGKDFARLGPLVPDGVSVWVVPERLVWRSGDDALAALIMERVGPPEC